jgi:hypothetical protein
MLQDSFRKMDEDSSEVHQKMRNKTTDALVFAVMMLIVAIVMGILYVTKKAPVCTADLDCKETVKKWEKIAKMLSDELNACQNQNC